MKTRIASLVAAIFLGCSAHSQVGEKLFPNTLEDFELKGKVKTAHWQAFIPEQSSKECTAGRIDYSSEYTVLRRFDKAGMLVSAELPSDSINTSFVSIAYNERHQIVDYSTWNQPQKEGQPESSWLLEYEDGNLVLLRDYMFGELQDSVIYAYSDMENSVYKTKYWRDGSVKSSLLETFDAGGNRLESQLMNGRGNQLWHYTFEYDASGKVSVQTSINADGSLGSKVLYSYDSQGQLKKEERFPGGEFDHSVHYAYDQNHNVSKEETLDREGTRISLIEYAYQYDKEENWTQRITFQDGICNAIIKVELAYY